MEPDRVSLERYSKPISSYFKSFRRYSESIL